MKSEILLTGASGFLGNILYSRLSKDNFTVFDINRISNKRIDITKAFSLNNKNYFDIVIHCAGKAHSIPRTKEEKEVFNQVNYQGTVNLCNAIDNLSVKPKAFIFISTVAVYGMNAGVDITEMHLLNGDTPYAKSKILAEAYLQDWALQNNILLSILRVPLIAGPNPPGNLGAMINGIKRNRYLSIGKADARKSIVWAEDIAKIIPKLSEIGGVYNLTDGYHPSFGALENAISNTLGKSNPIKISPVVAKLISRIGDLLGPKAPINTDKLNKITSTLIFNDSKARTELGWNPTKVLDKISEIVN